MSLILRVDVDKPYGRKSFARKIASKLAEDYWLPSSLFQNKYLIHLKAFLEYCNAEGVSGFIYHRLCTAPHETIHKLLKEGNHKVGFHTENTRSFETFSEELINFKKQVKSLKVESFTKHGSGELKLGKHHYPPYEPEKYKEWAGKANIGFYFGNGIAAGKDEMTDVNGFFPNMFWIEAEYRVPGFDDIRKVVEIAAEKDVVVLIHPCNFDASESVAAEFKLLVSLAKEKHIKWKVY